MVEYLHIIQTGAEGGAADAPIPWYNSIFFYITNPILMGTDIFLTGKLQVENIYLAGISFAIACFMFAFLFATLDICIFFIRKRSMFQLRYRLKNSLGLFIALPVAAGVVGFVGYSLDILQTTRSAAIAVGFAWPTFIVAFFNNPEAVAQGDDIDLGGEEL